MRLVAHLHEYLHKIEHLYHNRELHSTLTAVVLTLLSAFLECKIDRRLTLRASDAHLANAGGFVSDVMEALLIDIVRTQGCYLTACSEHESLCSFINFMSTSRSTAPDPSYRRRTQSPSPETTIKPIKFTLSRDFAILLHW
jgi:hypothetical protein